MADESQEKKTPAEVAREVQTAVDNVRDALAHIENRLVQQAETIQGLDDRISELMRRRGLKDEE